MKRILIVLATVLMLGVVAFAPHAQTSFDGVARPRRTPVGLTAPTLLSPANGSTVHTGNVTFAWSAVPGVARYHLQAGSGMAFDQQYNIIERWSLTDPSYNFNVSQDSSCTSHAYTGACKPLMRITSRDRGRRYGNLTSSVHNESPLNRNKGGPNIGSSLFLYKWLTLMAALFSRDFKIKFLIFSTISITNTAP